MKSGSIFGMVLGGVAVGFLADKYLNDGEVTEQIIQGAGVSTIKETIVQGAEVVRETIKESKEVISEVADDLNIPNLDSVKEKAQNLIPDINIPKIPNLPNTNFNIPTKREPSFFDKIQAGTNATYHVISGDANILSKSGKILANMALAPYTLGKEIGSDLGDRTKNLFTGNSGSSSNSKKKKSSTKYRNSSSSKKNLAKDLADKSVKKVVQVASDTKGTIKGSTNNKLKMSVNSGVTKVAEKNKVVKALGW